MGQGLATDPERPDRPGIDPDLSRYWTSGAWLESGTTRLWRQHADAVHRVLLERWLRAHAGPDAKPSSVLKTDLYEEAVGAGQVDWLAQRFDLVAGIDLTPAVVSGACRGRRLTACVTNIRRLPFRSASFDVVLSLSTLDHFAHAEAILEALAELARVLRPGGLLILTLDNAANVVIKLRQALPFPLLQRLGLVPYYCGPTVHPRRLRMVLQAAGFAVEDRTAILHCPRVLAVPLAAFLERRAPPAVGAAFLRILRACEKLGRLPSRYLTGYFVAARCVRTS